MSKKASKPPNCAFLPDISVEEQDALRWLKRTLEKLAANPRSKNQHKADLAWMAVGKLMAHTKEMHDLAHELEARVFELANEVTMDDFLVQMSKKTSKEGLN